MLTILPSAWIKNGSVHVITRIVIEPIREQEIELECIGQNYISFDP